MIENNEIVSSEKLCGEIYELCKQISVQQKIIMDVLNAEFPTFYTDNKEQLRKNNKLLTRSTQAVKEGRSIRDKIGEANELLLTYNENSDPLITALQDSKLID